MTDRHDPNAPQQPVIEADRADAWLALALTQQTPVGAHPDDDTLGAWHERSLDPAAAQQVELHVSQCEQCFAVWSGLLALETAPQAQQQADGVIARLTRALGGLFGTPTGVRRLGAVAAAMFAAVALSVLVFDDAQLLPGYSVSLEGNTKYLRNGADTTDTAVVFERGNQFRLILTPTSAYDEEVDAALYLLDAQGALAALATPTAEMADNGAVRIIGEVGSGVVLPAGETELLVVVGQHGRLPDAARLADALAAASTAGTTRWQAWRIAIQVVGD